MSKQPVEPSGEQIVDGGERPDDVNRSETKDRRERSSLKGIRILVADDDNVSLTITRHLLESHGCVTRTVIDGVEALDALRGEEFEVVILDVEMPRMDGPEAARNIRDPESKVLDPQVPIIGLTSLPPEVGRDRCIDAGMDEYLTKPVNPRLVYDAIMRQIKKEEEK